MAEFLRQGQSLKDCFQGNVIKVTDPTHKMQSLCDGIFKWNGMYWEKVDKLVFETEFLSYLDARGITKTTEQKTALRAYISSVTQPDTDIDCGHLFCIADGVVDVKAVCELKMQNSSIDLELYKEKWVHPHVQYKNQYITHFSSVSYISAQRRKPDLAFFLMFFQQALMGDEATMEWLLDYFSSTLWGENRWQQFVTFWGPPRTGKSTLVDTLVAVLGTYACLLPEGMLTDRQSDLVVDLYRLKNYRLLQYSETTNKKLKTSLLKRITGNSPFNAGGTTFKVTAKILIDTNYVLRSEDSKNDRALNERMVIIPFGRYVKPEERDEELKTALAQCKDALFSEMVDRIYKYKPDNTSKPAVSAEVQEKFWLLSNPVKAFYTTCCKPTNSDTDEAASELYTFFLEYFQEQFRELLKINGLSLFDEVDFCETLKSVTPTMFNKEMQFLHKKRANPGNRLVFKGLVLLKEKQYWGNSLDVVRDSPLDQAMEDMLATCKKAWGLMSTFSMPFAFQAKLKKAASGEDTSCSESLSPMTSRLKQENTQLLTAAALASAALDTDLSFHQPTTWDDNITDLEEHLLFLPRCRVVTPDTPKRVDTELSDNEFMFRKNPWVYPFMIDEGFQGGETPTT